MKKNNLITLLCFVAMIVIFLVILFYNYYIYIDTRDVAMDVTIGDKIGFNADTDALHFATLMPGQTGIKGINITNNFEDPVKVQIYVVGNISIWAEVSENNLIVYPNETKIIKISLKIPSNTQKGNYSGTLRTTYSRTVW